MTSRPDGVATHALSAPEFDDARWFPVDLNVPHCEYGFLALGADVLERSTFLDNRIEAELHEARTVGVDVAAQAAMPFARVAWLFHTSFCCSTLLARALHVPPYQVVLKEPLVLRRLGDARHAQWPVAGLLEPTVRLLARPWDPSGAVVIKPTHAALNIAVDLLEASPDSRGVILTSSLGDFLVSNLKKTAETQAKTPALAERALQAGTFHSRLPAAALAPPDLLAAAGLQWAAQRELCADILAAVGPHRLRIIDAATLLADLPGVAWQCAQWLQLAVPQDMLVARAGDVSQRNAKAVASEYDARRRAADVAMIKARCDSQISAARQWFDRFVLPAMRAEALTIAGTSCTDL
ncbi:MAG: hypothetical protein ACREPE_03630 [Lysobacter sp.]